MSSTLDYARIDRLVVKRGSDPEPGDFKSMSDLAASDRLVLLGEPGIGKSTAFAQAAADEGAEVVRAQDLVQNGRSVGGAVFIDALEEYRIGEPARNRLADIVRVLKASNCTRWRIACRAISLPEPEIRYLDRELGAFETWLLQPLSRFDIRTILTFWGEGDPLGFMGRVDAMAAGGLMTNPATLKLLKSTVLTSADISTRGALLREATHQMAHEINPDLPDRDDRPEPSRILAAAEVASLVLLLSGREDIWSSGRAPVGNQFVTQDHLLEARVDTLALRFALDTPLFVGAGGAFKPTHRIVAEYLAGRALARATDPAHGAAITVDRALAFLGGAEDRPAPALSGVFAWFVSELSRTRHVARALELARDSAEMIVFHGDPAMLPTEHRRAVLGEIGRSDPWFLSSARGATAIGGLAGEDLAADLIAVAEDPDESDHRRILVLEALSIGKPVESLRPRLLAMAADPNLVEGFRRRALNAALNGAADPVEIGRALLGGFSTEPDGGPLLLRLFALSGLIGKGATAAEVHTLLREYGSTRDRTTGNLRPLTDALIATPIPELFDAPFTEASRPLSRGYELADALERILAATVRASPDVTGKTIVTWVANLGLQPYSDYKAVLKEAIADWAAAAPERPQALYDAIVASQQRRGLWNANYLYGTMVGSQVPETVRETVVARLEAAAAEGQPDEEKLVDLGELAARLTLAGRQQDELGDRTQAVLDLRPTLHGNTLTWVVSSRTRPWEQDEAERLERQAAERQAQQDSDRKWLAEHAESVRSGFQTGALVFAAGVALGHEDGDAVEGGEDRLISRFGSEIASDIREGWERLATDFPCSVEEQGQYEGRRLTDHLETVAVVFMAERLAADQSFALPLPTAFAVLRGAYMLSEDAARMAVARIAIDRILRDQGGRDALLTFWAEALRTGATHVPHLTDFESVGSGLAAVVESLLRQHPDLPVEGLWPAIMAAARLLSPGDLRTLVTESLAKGLSFEVERQWRILAFALTPGSTGTLFDQDVVDDDGYRRLSEVVKAAVERGLSQGATEALDRDRIIVERLGSLTAPAASPHQQGVLQQLVSGAIHRLADSPLAAAGVILKDLTEAPALAVWNELLRNRMSAQDAVRREAEFVAPAPGDVARALTGGPPATPADLRAVLREVLADLGQDILTGPTSPWRGYWNFPSGADGSPKDENDCRDLLTDRLNDRLRPFRIPVAPSTEHRSRGNRRVDLVLIGENAASLPIEAKRHYNKEIWTAVQDQVVDYALSLRSSGHGVYLVFWFGAEYEKVPKVPAGLEPIDSAKALQQALTSQLPDAARGFVDVVVLDVAYQPTQTEIDAAAKAGQEPPAKPTFKPRGGKDGADPAGSA
ncbi:hypothetical protein [Caulobacter sp.]|uniref:hypothetical protein n=1 Tax=Caulobacter sp. TaxID=78 RepID=UPI0031CF26F2